MLLWLQAINQCARACAWQMPVWSRPQAHTLIDLGPRAQIKDLRYVITTDYEYSVEDLIRYFPIVQMAEDPETYSNFFQMRRGDGEHVYCVLVRGTRFPPRRGARTCRLIDRHHQQRVARLKTRVPPHRRMTGIGLNPVDARSRLFCQAIERDMRGRKLKLSRRQKKGREERRQPSSSFRIVRPDTGYTAGDKDRQVIACLNTMMHTWWPLLL